MNKTDYLEIGAVKKMNYAKKEAIMVSPVTTQIFTPLLVIIYYLRNFAPLSNVLGYKNEAYFSTK